MGNDGGSIPKRRELVKSAARAPTTSELKATALESLSHAWSFCPLSSDPLDKSNVVSDWRGRLYNYESILRGLIPSADDTAAPPVGPEDSSNITFASTGIRSLKDVVKPQFVKAEGRGKGKEEVYICPLSQKELGPTTKSVYIVPCGHVFYEVALREIVLGAESRHACPQCSEAFDDSNIIPILPTEEKDVKRLSERIERLRGEGLTHKLKREKNGKKDKKRKAENGEKDDGLKKQKNAEKIQRVDRLSGINNSATASLTAKVVAEMEASQKRRKLMKA